MSKKLIICMAFLLSGCAPNLGVAVATAAAATQQISDLQTAAAPADALATAQALQTLSPEPTVTSTPDPNFDWTGDWYFSDADSSVYITQIGKQISGSFYDSSTSITFSATLIANNQIALGVLHYSSFSDYPIYFQWRIVPGRTDQFQGSMLFFGEPSTFCGSRISADDSPVPCIWP